MGDFEMSDHTKETIGLENLNLVDITNRLWNKMTIDQRDKFLKNSDLDFIDLSKLWFELDEVQQFAIVKLVVARLGVSA